MHLLVIEDDPRLVRLLRRLLEEDRHVVETATTGLDGLDIAEARPGSRSSSWTSGCPTSAASTSRAASVRPVRRSRS
jgi:CheY-like chemotaxis protein